MKKNKLNERGSTLILVLIVILVFMVLGVSLMGNAISERKRVDATEQDAKARVLAQTGITYFESQFTKFIENNPDLTSEQLFSFFDSYEATVDENSLEGISLTVERNDFDVEVLSEGTSGSSVRTLTGHYRISFDIDKPSYEIADFTEEGTVATNFASEKVLDLGLGLLGLGLLNPSGSEDKFYHVPADEIISVKLLGPVLGLGIIGGDGFKTYRERNVVATREFRVLGLNLIGGTLSSFVQLNLLGLDPDEDTNVLINGCMTYLTLLGIQINRYSDIEFKKFAVLGNALIQQDRDGSSWLSTKDKNGYRRFTFNEGLYVNRSLVIGGEQDKDGAPRKWEDYSKLMLRGDMVAQAEVPESSEPQDPPPAIIISYVDLIIGDNDENENKLDEDSKVSNLYAHGDVYIKNAGIKMKNEKYDFGLFAKGKLTIENDPATGGCGSLNGLFYAEKGIEIKTNGRDMFINGGLVGNVTVDYPDKLHYKVAPEYMDKLSNIKLTLKKDIND